MEQPVKERLTGGVILVVLLVLLVPELLTGPRPPPQATPAQPDEAPMRSYTLDLRESPHANSAPVAASTTLAPASEPAVKVMPASAPPVPEARPAAEPPAAPPQPAAQTPIPTPSPKHARPVAPASHAAPAEAHAASGWTVQLATFSKRENAAHLVSTLKSHGFSASITDASKGGHPLFRVHVGAERDKAAAQKLLARLKAAGAKGGEVVPR